MSLLIQLMGEYNCRLDGKNRLRLPSMLLDQLGDAAGMPFVLNRGFESCLTLYPKVIWDDLTKKLQQLNLYVRKHRDLVRYFFRGATPLNLDSQSRLLLPNNLTEYASIGKELVVFAYFNRIELWSPELYAANLEMDANEWADLAEEVMGWNNGQAETDGRIGE